MASREREKRVAKIIKKGDENRAEKSAKLWHVNKYFKCPFCDCIFLSECSDKVWANRFTLDTCAECPTCSRGIGLTKKNLVSAKELKELGIEVEKNEIGMSIRSATTEL